MVQPGCTDLQVLEWRLENRRQIPFQRGNLVAHADELQERVFAQHRRHDGCHRVGIVEHIRVGTQLDDVVAYRYNHRRDAQRMENPARAAILAIHLTDAVLLRHRPILIPQFEPFADLDRDDHHAGSRQSFAPVGRPSDGKR
ncbi:hypothetical protein SDC9_203167 [bioreactor metagenome]|uniref:Uncharacterized protein n=1 Tax=bioreactor metagenome TaxID=1076179 RepID=A0A645IVN7_9ZZZZ